MPIRGGRCWSSPIPSATVGPRHARRRRRPRRPAPRSDRPAGCPCRAPRGSRHPRRPDRREPALSPMSRCCAPPLGTVKPLDAPSWLTALLRDDRADPVAVALRVTQPLEHEDSAAFTAHVAVGGGVEGLASPDGGKHPGAGGGDDCHRTQQDVDTAGQRQVAVTRSAMPGRPDGPPPAPSCMRYRPPSPVLRVPARRQPDRRWH